MNHAFEALHYEKCFIFSLCSFPGSWESGGQGDERRWQCARLTVESDNFSYFSVVSRCHSSKANRNNLLNIKCTHDSSLTTLAGVVVVVVGWALLKHRIMGCNLHSIKCFYMHVFAVYNFSWENILWFRRLLLLLLSISLLLFSFWVSCCVCMRSVAPFRYRILLAHYIQPHSHSVVIWALLCKEPSELKGKKKRGEKRSSTLIYEFNPNKLYKRI